MSDKNSNACSVCGFLETNLVHTERDFVTYHPFNAAPSPETTPRTKSELRERTEAIAKEIRMRQERGIDFFIEDTIKLLRDLLNAYETEQTMHAAWRKRAEEAESAAVPPAAPPRDNGCICEGNWRKIVAESEPDFGKRFTDESGRTYTFFGIVHGSDDYYYGMSDGEKVRLLSCVGSIEGHGFTQAEAAPVQGERLSKEKTMPKLSAIDFYNKYATNMVHVPRVGSNDRGGRVCAPASEARYFAKDCPVMQLGDAVELAEHYARYMMGKPFLPTEKRDE